MRRLLSNPFLWLGFQSLLLFTQLWTQGAFEPETTPDTPDYIRMSEAPIFSKAALSDIRTLGYPFYLKSVSLLSGNDDRINQTATVGHFLAHVLAVVIFCWGLRRIGMCGWRSLVLASTILYAGWQYEFRFSLVMSDSLGLSLAIAAIGCFLATLTQHRSMSPLIAMAGLIFTAYQVRPAYIFLVAWLPVMGTILLANVAERDVFRASIWQKLTGWLTATLVPLIVYCAIRWIIVGHFGLVSIGGFNTLGLTALFLTDDLLPQLPEDKRPLAEEILENRDHLTYVRHNGDVFTYTPVKPTEVFLISDQYTPVLYRAVRPPLTQRHGKDWVALNTQAGELSRAIVLHRPYDYTVWCISAAKYVPIRSRAYWHVYKPTLVLIAAVMLYYVIRVVSPRGFQNVAMEEAEWRTISTCFILAVSFFACGTVVSVLGAVPFDRYIIPITVFIPLIPISLLLVVIPRWFGSPGQQDKP